MSEAVREMTFDEQIASFIMHIMAIETPFSSKRDLIGYLLSLSYCHEREIKDALHTPTEEQDTMSILIKGMEMPEHCGYCRFRYDGICHALQKTQYNKEDCPLVPVPPHGDLRGREWLIDIALHLMNTAKNDDISNGVKWLLQYIIDAPTIIPADEGE